ncbi:glycosyltransferase [Algoriphagus marincola]|uniref:glycosyltransferase n=1 Tax=Algoriphagus marincola TaxID=264027 RepID=UPI000419C98C|nr:glycosyltransferase [Algoriphagus marincola]
MKILQLVTSRKSRGAEISAFLLSQELVNLGHEVSWIGLYSVNPSEELFLRDSENIDLGGDPNKKIDLKLVRSLRKVIRASYPDIIQANGSDTWKYAVLALIGNKKPKLVYRNISIMSHWVGNRSWIKFIYQLLAKRVDYFCSVGEVANQDIRGLLNLPKDKCGVIRRGIPIESVESNTGRIFLESTFGIRLDDFVLVQVGRLSPEKNFEFSIRLIKELRNDYPNLKLIIVGEGPERPKLEQLVFDLGIQDSVLFLGYQKSYLSKILAGSDLMILPSLVEGVPGVVMEAMINRVPVVAFDVGGVPELVKSGETGWCVPSNDSQAFIHAIQEVISLDNDSKQKILDQAHHLVTIHYSLPQVTLQFEQFYKSLLDKN